MPQGQQALLDVLYRDTEAVRHTAHRKPLVLGQRGVSRQCQGDVSPLAGADDGGQPNLVPHCVAHTLHLTQQRADFCNGDLMRSLPGCLFRRLANPSLSAQRQKKPDERNDDARQAEQEAEDAGHVAPAVAERQEVSTVRGEKGVCHRQRVCRRGKRVNGSRERVARERRPQP